MSEVVVIGSGSAGMAAALSAALEGAQVTVLEAGPALGGTTALSGGVVWLPDNPWSAALGYADSRDAGLRYLRALGKLGYSSDEMCKAYLDRGGAVMKAIEEHTPIRWHVVPYPDYHAELDGGTADGRAIEPDPVQVTHEAIADVLRDPFGALRGTMVEAAAGGPPREELERREREAISVGGRGLIAAMAAAIRERGAAIRVGARATALIGDTHGVRGAVVDGEEIHGSVVLASGGFERSEDLTTAFLRAPLGAPAGPPTNVGDGLRMGMSVGAALGNMSEAWWAPAMHVPGRDFGGAPLYSMLFTDCGQPGGILVDSFGRRFVDEAACYSCLGRGFQSFDAGRYGFPGAGAWLIFDAGRRGLRGFGDEEAWTLAPGAAPSVGASAAEEVPDWIERADSLPELARAIDVPVDALVETVETYNRHAAIGSDPVFGRGEQVYDRFIGGPDGVRPIEGPPYFALRVLNGALGTKGGPCTDASGAVLRASDGARIPGLFAAGNAAASPFGCSYPGPGATVGAALVFGWLAGQAAAG